MTLQRQNICTPGPIRLALHGAGACDCDPCRKCEELKAKVAWLEAEVARLQASQARPKAPRKAKPETWEDIIEARRGLDPRETSNVKAHEELVVPSLTPTERSHLTPAKAAAFSSARL